jgi:hypothetical protein
MRSSPYNNPMMAQGLAGLVQSFIGNPSAEAQAQEAASRALLNNQTAQFRDAIGETGLSGDLAAMMIRSLQAGPDYSRYAPGIGDASIRMGAMGFGRPELTPQGDIASMFLRAGRGGGGGGRSGSGGAGGGRPMTAGERSAFLAAARRAGMTDEMAWQSIDSINEGVGGGSYPSVATAFSHYLNPENWEREPVEDERGFLARMFTSAPDPESGRLTGVRPMGGAAPVQAAPQAAPQTLSQQDIARILNDAREAIARDAPRGAVEARLREMGIDPGGL